MIMMKMMKRKLKEGSWSEKQGIWKVSSRRLRERKHSNVKRNRKRKRKNLAREYRVDIS